MALPRRLSLATNCFVYLLDDPRSRRAEWLAAEVFMPMAAGHISVVTSVITVAELLVRPYRLADLVGARRLRDALETMPGLELRPVHTSLADQAAELRGKTGIPLPDALRAATMTEAGVDWTPRSRTISAGVSCRSRSRSCSSTISSPVELKLARAPPE